MKVLNMAKVNMKQVLLEKGERYAFFAALGLMVIFMVIGVINLSDSPDTDQFVSDVDKNTSRINSAISGAATNPPDLPVYAKKVEVFPSVQMAPLKHLAFDPINPPDMKRTNPIVKAISEIQADFVWVKMPALDIKETEDGKLLIGVVVSKAKADNADKEKQSTFVTELDKRLKRSRPKSRTNPNPMGIMGGAGNNLSAGGGIPPSGMGGGPSGGGPPGMFGNTGGPAGPPLGMGGGPSGGGPPGMFGAGGAVGGIGKGPSGGGPPGMLGNLGMGGKLGLSGSAPPMGIGMHGMGNPAALGGMMPGGNFGNQIDVGERFGIDYIPLEADKLEGKRLAITIYPQRMVIIHAAFPYREQVQEIARALRIKEPGDVLDPKNDAAPIFKGFLIQRQILYPDGRVAAPWHPLNYESYYKDTIFPRALGDQPDNPDLAYVKLPPESEFVMPLPSLEALKGTYPEVHIESIWNTIRAFKDASKPPTVPKAGSRLNKEGSIFNNNKIDQGGIGAQPNSPEFTWGSKKGKGSDTKMGENGAAAAQIKDLPESVLLRLIDNDIIPGRLYQYRMKVLMQNPNWAGEADKNGKYEKNEKFDLVSQRQDAKRMLLGASEEDAQIIEQKFFADVKDEKARADEVRWNLDKKDVATPWVQMNGFVNVPQEEYIFAVDPPLPVPDPKDPKKSASGPTLKPGEGLLQFQKWMPTANIKGFKEPVADWVVADVLAKKGYYLGGDQFVNLPIWSSEFNRYILRKVPADKDAKHKESKRGVVMDPTKPGMRYAVVDVEGGTINRRFGAKTIEEEAATEIMLVDEEGNLYVRETAFDRNLPSHYMPNPNGPYVLHPNGQVSQFDPKAKYEPGIRRAVDREEVWNKWVEETDKASRAVDPDTGTPGGKGPGKFD